MPKESTKTKRLIVMFFMISLYETEFCGSCKRKSGESVDR
jgi:hypothetical protein